MLKKATISILCWTLVFLCMSPWICCASAEIIFSQDDSAELISPEQVVEITEIDSGGIVYSFTNKSLDDSDTLIQCSALLIDAARDKYKFQKDLERITYVDTNDENMVSNRRVNINPYDEATLGMLLFHQSDGKLPAWLCAGLEIYCLETSGMNRSYVDFETDVKEWALSAEQKGLPGFGDVWLIPGIIGNADELREQFPSVAYQYVCFRQSALYPNNTHKSRYSSYQII